MCDQEEYIERMDDSDRARWRSAWSSTNWLYLSSQTTWLPLSGLAASMPQTAISAFNPGCQRLPESVNQARDSLLGDELRAWGLTPLRVRGGDDAQAWREDVWLIPHHRTRDLQLLRRYGQLAALIIEGGMGRLLWADGHLDQDDVALL